MSKWFKAMDEDIAVDDREKEVDILVHQDDDGNVYVSLSFSQVETLCEKLFFLTSPKKRV